MDWRNPALERPKSGEIVWVIYQHNKEHKPRSCQLMCGEVEGAGNYLRVDSNDFTGSGSWCVYFDQYGPDADGDEYYRNDDIALAWIPAAEFPLPDWIPHSPAWECALIKGSKRATKDSGKGNSMTRKAKATTRKTTTTKKKATKKAKK